jgi:hypothetical protein
MMRVGEIFETTPIIHSHTHCLLNQQGQGGPPLLRS